MSINITGMNDLNAFIRSMMRYVQRPAATFARMQPVMLADVMRHFQNEEGPEGKWEPLKTSTLVARWYRSHGGQSLTVSGGTRSRAGAVRFFGSARILQDKGDLRVSVSTRADGKGAEVGTNKVYAKTHQHGDDKRHIPRRTFVFLSSEAQERCLNLFMDGMKEIPQ